jgi:hypothetical protein
VVHFISLRRAPSRAGDAQTHTVADDCDAIMMMWTTFSDLATLAMNAFLLLFLFPFFPPLVYSFFSVAFITQMQASSVFSPQKIFSYMHKYHAK